MKLSNNLLSLAQPQEWHTIVKPDRDGVSMLDGGGTYLLGPNDDFYDMGHNSVYHFEGKDYLFCHANDKNHRGRPKLVVK